MVVRVRVHRAFRVMVPAGLVLLATACGHKSSGTSSSGSGGSSKMAIVESAKVGGVGTVLVNGAGRTLYMLTADKGDKVTCTSTACTGAWPPLLLPAGTSAPTGGTGVTAAMLGTAKAPSGTQVTYGQWPLYTFSGDTGAGQANGQGIKSFGGVWHPVAPSGQPVSSSGVSSGGGGY